MHVKTRMALERFEVAKSGFLSSKSAENQAASSLLVGGHRYAGIFCISKLIWV